MRVVFLLFVIVVGAVFLVATFLGVVRGELQKAFVFFIAASICGLVAGRLTTPPEG